MEAAVGAGLEFIRQGLSAHVAEHCWQLVGESVFKFSRRVHSGGDAATGEPVIPDGGVCPGRALDRLVAPHASLCVTAPRPSR